MKNLKSHTRCMMITSSILILMISCIGVIFIFLNNRVQPKSTNEYIFQGVEYIRAVRTSPRKIVIHVIKVDLKAKGIRTLVTEGNPEAAMPLSGRTTGNFLSSNGLQVAINGDGFTPWHSNSILDVYPHSGDPVDVIGLAASKGILYSDETDKEPTLFISEANQARINTQIGKLYNAISGNLVLLRNGKIPQNLEEKNPDPRTAVALDRANRNLILIVVDGRQPGYSEGVSLIELAEIISYYDGYNAINLDGGGSSTLVIEGPLGTSKILNSPINNGVPGKQRVVGNHLGIYAKPLEE